MPKKIISIAIVALGIVSCSEQPVAPVPHVIAPVPATFAANGGIPIAGQFIVRFADTEQNVDAQANRVAAQYNARITQVYRSAIKGVALELPITGPVGIGLVPAAVTALRADPRVLLVEQDQTLSIVTTQSGAT